MFTSINIKSIVLIIFLLAAGSIYLNGQDNKQAPGQTECFSDSLKTIVLEKINFYISEQKKNSETIEALQKELEQRRALNERLNGAAAAAQEILFELQRDNARAEKQIINQP